MDTLKLGTRLTSNIRIRHLDAAGTCVGELTAHNDFTYAAADVLMTALLRSGPSQVTYLYARYGGGNGSGSEGIIVPTNADLKRTTRNDFVAQTNVNNGGLWVPLLATPIQTTDSPSLYSLNKVTFMFRIPANISAGQTQGAAFDASTSYIGSLGLAVPPNYTGDRAQDVIFSVLQHTNFEPDPVPFLVPIAGQTAIDYSIELIA